MVLGLDLSTTVCGICVLSLDYKIQLLTHYSFVSKEMLEKGKELKILIDNLFEKYPITNFFIEERLEVFQKGRTNAAALGKTSAINFLCQYMIYTKSIPVTPLNVMHVRSVSYPGFHKIARATKGEKHKELIFKFVLNELGVSYFPTKILKSGSRKGETVYLEEAKDRADAFVIAKCGLLELKNNIKV